MRSNQILKAKIKWSCRFEYIGAGYYFKLSESYSEDKNLSDIFKKFAKHELKHGIMFNSFYKKNYKTSLGKNLWLYLGKFTATVQRPIPIKWKLKILSSIEGLATKQIERIIQSGNPDPYMNLLKKILPDEVAHASIYRKLYPV